MPTTDAFDNSRNGPFYGSRFWKFPPSGPFRALTFALPPTPRPPQRRADDDRVR